MALDLDKRTVMAFTLLALGLLVAVPQLLPDGGRTVIVDGELFEDEEPAAAATVEGAAADTGPRVDLIARFGSWTPGAALADPFAEFDVAAEPESAPEADAAPVAAGPAPFPPAHHVSLVLLAGAVPRAVVDERVVSLGDELAAGRIVELTATGLTVTSATFGRLDYDLGVPGARGWGVAPAASADGTDSGEDAWAAGVPDEPARSGPFAPPGEDASGIEADPDALADTAERLLQELYATFGSPPPEGPDGGEPEP